MRDKYDTKWQIRSKDGSQVLEWITPMKFSFRLADFVTDMTIEFNTERDCRLFLQSWGIPEDDYCFVEICG